MTGVAGVRPIAVWIRLKRCCRAVITFAPSSCAAWIGFNGCKLDFIKTGGYSFGIRLDKIGN